jgi:glycosyltransferase involved in cell wall biosynthesis
VLFEKPLLSVIISSYNSGHLLEGCLESLGNQKTDKLFEIVVVDSSPNGLTRGIGEKFPKVRWYRFPERKFCGDARNFGLSVTRGEIIAFIDADCRAEPDWIDNILKAHQSPHLAIGGAIANGNPDSLIGWAAYFCEFSQWMPNTPSKPLSDIAGANMSYKRKAFEIFGPLIEGTYSSDTEFHWRLGSKGHKLQFHPSMLVSHHNIQHLGKFLRHELEHGRSFARVRVLSQDFSKWRKWFYGTFSFLIPGWLFLKVGARNFKNRTYLSYFLKTWPLLTLGLMSWSLGECLGYLLPTKACFKK